MVNEWIRVKERTPTYRHCGRRVLDTATDKALQRLPMNSKIEDA